ncbi:cytohesin-1 isoform X1 [Bactrocera tryoni]|uniref:cytohesin-1 isoform X1 n=1 Tax=Bactrocera tryoni TaxID=59916 RepID=UPI001A971FD5|nr:cytohesin-1 isoform X1 [Bactrocera tryoni]XP_039950384.1 cytohesin-1 isoform X1 [Bactrocera tryoni]XP_039950385.1 cytohesin-1 isoform X1 [Bactrocera tryoni]
MASLQQYQHQKRPSITNWFSSLRRQPKNKKAAALQTGGDKHFQRSCIDLSANSTFYVPQVELGDKKGGQCYLPSAGASIDNLQDDEDATSDDKRALVSGKRVSQLCSRCCCSSKYATSSRPETPQMRKRADTTPAHVKTKPTTPTTPTTPKPKAKSPAKETPYFSMASHHIPALTDNPIYEGLTTTAPITLSSQRTVEKEVRRNVDVTRAPCDEPNTLLLTKRSEFTRSVTTTIQNTMVITRPVELVLNERGEVVARRPQRERVKQRSNSLDNVLNEDEECGGDADTASANSMPICALRHGASPLNDVGGGDLRFIDDSSTSQSETERSAQQHNNKENNKPSCNGDNKAFAKNLQLNLNVEEVGGGGGGGVGGNGVLSCGGDTNGYDNNNYLCDDCRNVLVRNRNNAAQNAVILRNNNKQIKDELGEVVSEMEALDVPEENKHSNKEKQMSIGRKKFNMDPKKGIEYLVENRLLRHDPQDVAHFLYKGEGLNKTAIGDYLGEKNDFNEDVLKAFVALHDFTNLILVQALRQFLWSFRLPGEAQKIDRMMECFAQRYCQLNPDIFTNTDTCYVLSFAIIMLNTSLHNPSVKDKPTVEHFISMNRGINNGGDLPRGLLESLYESIRTEPFKIPQDDGNDLMHTFFNPDKEGWLWKQGGRYKSWKRRWFILNDNCLYYFEYTTDKEPRGIIPLENISVREIHDRSKPHCFELFATGGADIIKACKTDSEGKVVEGKHTVYRMSAATEEDQQEWIKRLTQSISHNPFYDILVQRKKKALSKS